MLLLLFDGLTGFFFLNFARVLLSSPGWSAMHYVDILSQSHENSPASVSQEFGFSGMCTPWLLMNFNVNPFMGNPVSYYYQRDHVVLTYAKSTVPVSEKSLLRWLQLCLWFPRLQQWTTD